MSFRLWMASLRPAGLLLVFLTPRAGQCLGTLCFADLGLPQTQRPRMRGAARLPGLHQLQFEHAIANKRCPTINPVPSGAAATVNVMIRTGRVPRGNVGITGFADAQLVARTRNSPLFATIRRCSFLSAGLRGGHSTEPSCMQLRLCPSPTSRTPCPVR